MLLSMYYIIFYKPLYVQNITLQISNLKNVYAYTTDTESWQLVSNAPSKENVPEGLPPPRHKHSAILHEGHMWVYGGMTDLQERSDLWKWDVATGSWTMHKAKLNPGSLHSHSACRLPSCMVVFGGEHDGHVTNDVWRFSFGELTDQSNFNILRFPA